MECKLYVPLFAGCVEGGRKFKFSVLRKNCDRKRHALQSISGCSSLTHLDICWREPMMPSLQGGY